jgi:hypothetical protein
MKDTRRALIASGISLFLCVAMLVSVTVAWFARDVKSTAKVTSGTFGVEVTYQDIDTQPTAKEAKTYTTYTVPGINNGETFVFKEASTQLLNANEIPKDTEDAVSSLLDLQNMEPGSSGAKLITVTNTGTLTQTIQLVLAVDKDNTTVHVYEQKETSATDEEGNNIVADILADEDISLTAKEAAEAEAEAEQAKAKSKKSKSTEETDTIRYSGALDEVIYTDFLFVPSEEDLKAAQAAVSDPTQVETLSTSAAMTYGMISSLTENQKKSDDIISTILKAEFNSCKLSELEEKKLSQNQITLKGGESISFILWYQMDEKATLEYMGLSYAATITVQAKQAADEADSFGQNAYDSSASYYREDEEEGSEAN